MAEAWPEEAWESLERLPRYEIATAPRGKKERIKEAIVRFKGYQNKVLVGKSIAEFDYQPNKCGRSYRLVVVRQNISVRQGEAVLFDEARYFFYITNHIDYGAPEIVALANGRCAQETSRPGRFILDIRKHVLPEGRTSTRPVSSVTVR